mgnify:CR=1 FL=1
MKITAESRSDQLNADDFVTGPRVYTIAGAKKGAAEQPFDIELTESPGRVWRPPITVRKILIGVWGDETAKWVGRRVELYRDDSVTFGPEAVGGIRVSKMSDLPTGDRPYSVKLLSKRGKRTEYVVEPLPAAAPPISDDDAIDFERDIAEATSLQALNKVGADLKAANLGGHADKLRAAWSARKAEIEGGEK